VSAACGIDGRQTPWKPSQPAMKSHARSISSPAERERTRGAADSIAVDAHVADSNRISPPAARRAAMRSFTTSCWP
jgi:hypothetical protein